MDYIVLTQNNKILQIHLFLRGHFDADSTITQYSLWHNAANFTHFCQKNTESASRRQISELRREKKGWTDKATLHLTCQVVTIAQL